ncbi:MAG TPA: DUF2142 domain-containing protein [Anaerolineales bacterium]|nr:DUF2142 domain-containing protein [Anaerolineales bacterium]
MQKVLSLRKKSLLTLLLYLATAQGLVFLWLTPPWWHYDEPGHFEFAWELAHFDHWPQPGEIDLAMRRRIARSMLDYDWYHHYPHDQWPVLSRPEPPYIGPAPQYTPYPLYYLVVSLPLRAVGGWDPANQLRLARLVSVIMLVLTIGAAWGALGEVLPSGHPLRWLIPAFLASLPGFLDIMTSVNDDVGAALTGTLFVWASLRILRRGLNLRRLMALLTTAAAAFWTKNTTWPLLLTLPWTLYFGLPWRSRRLTWMGALIGIVLVLALVLRWDDPFLWFRGSGIQEGPIRIQTHQALLGEWAFFLAPQGPNIGQWIPVTTAPRLRGKPVTIGLWLWSDSPTKVSLPRLCVRSGCTQTRMVKVTTQPQFFSLTTTFPSGHYPRLVLPHAKASGKVYADGLLLVQGAFHGTPSLVLSQGDWLIWEGQTVPNVLRNASAERGGPRLHPAIQRRLMGKFPASLDLAIASLLDPLGSAPLHKDLIITLYRTFWGHLARNKVDLLGAPTLYRFLLLFTLAGLLGALVAAWQKRERLPWEMVVLLLLTLMGPWLTTYFRGLGTGGAVIPWARYASPAILPTALLLCSGWYFGLQRPGLSTARIVHLLLAFFLTLSVVGWASLIHYFYPDFRSWVFILLEIPLFLAILWALRHLTENLHLARQDSHK